MTITAGQPGAGAGLRLHRARRSRSRTTTTAGVDVPLAVTGVGNVAQGDVLDRRHDLHDRRRRRRRSASTTRSSATWSARWSAPDGTTVTLFDRQRPGRQQHLPGRVRRRGDAQHPSAASADAPFTGTWRPETPLAALNGHAADGTWKFHVADDARARHRLGAGVLPARGGLRQLTRHGSTEGGGRIGRPPPAFCGTLGVDVHAPRAAHRAHRPAARRRRAPAAAGGGVAAAVRPLVRRPAAVGAGRRGRVPLRGPGAADDRADRVPGRPRGPAAARRRRRRRSWSRSGRAGSSGRATRSGTARSPVRREAIPVRRHAGQTGRSAVVGRDTNLVATRGPSKLELAYLDAANDLCRMVGRGHVPADRARTRCTPGRGPGTG